MWPAAAAACLLVLILIAIFYDSREHFTARATQIHGASTALFARGRTTYKAFREKVERDPVLFRDLKSAWQAGALTPAAVEAALHQ